MADERAASDFDGGADVAAREVEALAQIDGRRPMTYAEKEEMHVRSVTITGTYGWS